MPMTQRIISSHNELSNLKYSDAKHTDFAGTKVQNSFSKTQTFQPNIITLGAELLTNGNFATDLNGWSNPQGQWFWDHGAKGDPDAVDWFQLEQTITTVIDTYYLLSIVVENGSVGKVDVWTGFSLDSVVVDYDNGVSRTEIMFKATDTSTYVDIYAYNNGNGAFNGTVKSVSIVPVTFSDAILDFRSELGDQLSYINMTAGYAKFPTVEVSTLINSSDTIVKSHANNYIPSQTGELWNEGGALMWGGSDQTRRSVALLNNGENFAKSTSGNTFLAPQNIEIDEPSGEIGSELLINNSFDTDLSDWVNIDNVWDWDSGSAIPINSTEGYLLQDVTITGEQGYILSLTVSNHTVGDVIFSWGPAELYAKKSDDTEKLQQIIYTSNAWNGVVSASLFHTADFDGKVDEVSIKLYTFSQIPILTVGTTSGSIRGVNAFRVLADGTVEIGTLYLDKLVSQNIQFGIVSASEINVSGLITADEIQVQSIYPQTIVAPNKHNNVSEEPGELWRDDELLKWCNIGNASRTVVMIEDENVFAKWQTIDVPSVLGYSDTDYLTNGSFATDLSGWTDDDNAFTVDVGGGLIWNPSGDGSGSANIYQDVFVYRMSEVGVALGVNNQTAGNVDVYIYDGGDALLHVWSYAGDTQQLFDASRFLNSNTYRVLIHITSDFDGIVTLFFGKWIPSDQYIFRAKTVDGSQFGGNAFRVERNGFTKIDNAKVANQLILDKDTMQITGNRTITNSNDPGIAGEVCFDDEYIYRCVADNTWKRTALSTW